MPTMALMKWGFAGVLVALSAAMSAHAAVPLYDSIALNIGFNCRWQQSCIGQQQRAMRHSLAYVQTRKPPAWRVQLCNRNASRGRNRVDWVGFDNCIRNAALRPPGVRGARKHRRH